jgi:hypothetical protein
MVMQTAALFLPTGIKKKTATKTTPNFVEKKIKKEKVCFLLQGRVNGNQKNASKNRR